MRFQMLMHPPHASTIRPFIDRSRAFTRLGAMTLVGAISFAQSAGAQAAKAASVRSCSASQVAAWLGNGDGGATAGTTFYPLEFSNVSHRSCSLYGYPGVSAISSSGTQVGRAATRFGRAPQTVVLAPGATAHAILCIVDWGAVCSKASSAQGLRVYAPGETTSTPISDFSFQVCAHKSTLRIEPIAVGVGIPGNTAG
jgi:hypothetical protein